MKPVVMILTFNEELHLERCLRSVLQLTDQILVVDCFSTDRTIDIAKQFSAKILQRTWENNHSTQVNWALTQLPAGTQWVMRIDADEILSPQLIAQILSLPKTLDPAIHGISCARKMVFQGQLIRFGGVGTNRVMRLFRAGSAKSESRWMDEHIKVEGRTIHLSGAIIDDNLHSLEWWKEKHVNYAKREAIDLLNLEFGFAQQTSVANVGLRQSSISTKRWVKENLYARLPHGARTLAYFVLRYFIMAGFLDGLKGSQFHYLQAYWYRSLADQNVTKVKTYIKEYQVTPQKAIQEVLGISV